jgi:hypothetical protein
MFVIVATKPLNDGTKGFRFNVLGIKGLVRKRKYISRGLQYCSHKCMTGVHIGRLSVYVQRSANKQSTRMIRHFAG